MDLRDFFIAHYEIEFRRRHNISEYWEENHGDDIIARLGPRQLNYLLTIDRFGPCSLQTIMHRTGMSSSAVSAAVEKLVREGVVDRVRNPNNRREVLVSLTPAITAHLRHIDARFRRAMAELLADCTPEEEAAIAAGATVLRRKLEKKTE